MSTKKKVLLIAGGSLLALLTIVNVNMGRKNTSFIGTILSNVEAYASSSEGGDYAGQPCVKEGTISPYGALKRKCESNCNSFGFFIINKNIKWSTCK